MVKEGLRTRTDEDAIALEIAKLKILTRIIAYVNSYEWLSRAQTREKMKAFLQSKYNYREVAERFGIKKSTLQVAISHANRRLEQKIGSKTIDLNLEGKIELASVHTSKQPKRIFSLKSWLAPIKKCHSANGYESICIYLTCIISPLNEMLFNVFRV